MDFLTQHPTAVVDLYATWGEGCAFKEFVVIRKGVKMGSNVIVEPHCYIGEEVSIGNDVIIGANVVILAGITIGEEAEISPGAVIKKDVPAGAHMIPVGARSKPARD